MGPRSHNHEQLVIAALVAVVVGLAIAGYLGVTARLGAGGRELSWIGHLALFAMMLALNVVALFLLWAALMLLGAAWDAIAWISARVGRAIRPS